MTNQQNIVTPWVCELSQTSTNYESCCMSIPAGPTEEEVSPGLMRPDPQHRNTPNVPRCAPKRRLHWDASPKVKEVVAKIAPEQTPPSTIPRHCWRLSVREAFVRSVCQPHHREPLANGLHCFWMSFLVPFPSWKNSKWTSTGRTRTCYLHADFQTILRTLV